MKKSSYICYIYRLTILLLAVLTAIVCCACVANGIREDALLEELPPIDPEAGLTRDISVKLYYRLTGEKYIVGVTRNVSIKPNERDEEAIIRTLLAGVPPMAVGISAVFPENTRLIDVALDGKVLHITLSEEFFTTSNETNAWTEGSRLRRLDRITDEEFAQMVAAAVAEDYLCRRLTIYSIVNTITEYASDLRVLVWIMSDNKYTGLIPRSELGLEPMEAAEVDMLEAMTYETSVVATPQHIVECALNHIMKNDFEIAYGFFADMDSTGQQKPDYAQFETMMYSIGRVLSYETDGYMFDKANPGIAHVNVIIDIERYDGSEIKFRGTVETKREGDIYLVGYSSLINLVKGGN